jgi:hypothetical protein
VQGKAEVLSLDCGDELPFFDQERHVHVVVVEELV